MNTGKFSEARRGNIAMYGGCAKLPLLNFFRRKTLVPARLRFYEASRTGKTIVAVRLRLKELRMPRKSRRDGDFRRRK